MQRIARASWFGYVVALVAVAAAVSLRFALDPLLGSRVPFVFFFGAVIVAAWLGGAGPGALAAVLGFVAGEYFFLDPRGTFAIGSPADLAALAAYLVTALLIAWLGGAMHAARRRVEASEERWHKLMENSPALVFLKDAEGRYVFMNRALQEFLGIAGSDWRGKTDRDLLPEPVARQICDNDRSVLRAGAPATFELAIPRPEGERHFYSTKFPLRDAGETYVAGMTIDVTDQRRSEQELRVEREQLRIVTDTTSVAIARCSRDLTYLWVNRRCADWLGKEQKQVVGRPIAEVIGAEALEAIRPYIDRVLAGEHVRYERLVQYPGLGRRWMSVAFEPTWGPDERPNGWVSVFSDIHERKRIEEALRDADRRKDEFLAGLAHELRNPLAPIRNAVAILGRKGPLDPELAWSREVIDRQVDHLSRLVDDLLDIARITSGKLLVRRERVTLERVIDLALETSRPNITAAGHSISVLLPSEHVMVDADPTRLAQVFSNLLNNAARYSEPRGSIALSATLEDDAVLVSVEDQGIGFPPEVAAQIFEPFSQFTSASGRSHGGLGIGLTLVKGIVALHDGTVEARSSGPGKGSEFLVRLPLATSLHQEKAFTEKKRSLAALAPGLRVLVADDNRDTADSLQRILALYGYDVKVAYDGATALSLADAFQPKVAVLDIGMPGTSGYDVARAIRSRQGNGVTLVALTGWGQEGDRRRALEAGFDYHLTKPVDPAVLNDLLVEVAGKQEIGV